MNTKNCIFAHFLRPIYQTPLLPIQNFTTLNLTFPNIQNALFFDLQILQNGTNNHSKQNSFTPPKGFLWKIAKILCSPKGITLTDKLQQN
jgi:hypothetical protein